MPWSYSLAIAVACILGFTVVWLHTNRPRPQHGGAGVGAYGAWALIARIEAEKAREQAATGRHRLKETAPPTERAPLSVAPNAATTRAPRSPDRASGAPGRAGIGRPGISGAAVKRGVSTPAAKKGLVPQCQDTEISTAPLRSTGRRIVAARTLPAEAATGTTSGTTTSRHTHLSACTGPRSHSRTTPYRQQNRAAAAR